MNAEPSPPVSASAAPASPEGLRRRVLRVRNTRWAQATAATLTRLGARPNVISLAGVGFAVVGAAAFVGAGQAGGVAPRVALLLLAAGCVQARLLCNLFDGMVAVEGGRRSRTGEIYNELPDRFSDALFLAAAGYATAWIGWERDLGWAAAVLAVTTAYVRAFGGQLGAAQQFCGPMAKQHRMAVLTAACVTSSVEIFLGWQPRTLTIALGVIALGSLATIFRRTRRIMRELEAK